MNRVYFLKIIALALTLLAWSAVSSGDTLFKEKTPLAIGHGTKQGKKLHWTDCDGTNPKDYDAPPYWMDPGANCTLSTDSFGLAISDTAQTNSASAQGTWTRFVVRDESFPKKLFPKAKTGDTIMLYRGNDSIKFEYDGQLWELKTRNAGPIKRAP
jgi:hypothetical protein